MFHVLVLLCLFWVTFQICTSSIPAPPSSVFFLGGSVEFPNLSFSSELTDSSSPQFHLQAQALNHYVSGTADLSITASPLNDIIECVLTFPLWAPADLAGQTLMWSITGGFQCKWHCPLYPLPLSVSVFVWFFFPPYLALSFLLVFFLHTTFLSSVPLSVSLC